MPLKKKVAKKKATKRATRASVKPKAPSAKPVHATFLLDETGSMNAIKMSTISGFNEYVETLRRKTPDLTMTFVTFNSQQRKTHFAGRPIRDVPALTAESYRPDFMTPLYDAVGEAIVSTEDEAKTKDILFIIMTDGQENASREWDQRRIFELIGQKRATGWSFVFLGTDQDTWGASAKMGVPYGNTFRYDHGAAGQTISGMAHSTVAYVANAGARLDVAKGDLAGGFFANAGEKPCPLCGKFHDKAARATQNNCQA